MPFFIPLLFIGAAITGGVMGAQAAQQQGKDQQSMEKYNARVEEQKAKQIEAKATYDSRRQAELASRRMASLESEIGASGAVSTAGSPLLIMAKQASENELDNLMIGYEGQIGAGEARSQAQLDIMQGKLYRKAGRNKAMASYIGAGTTILGGFASGMSFGGGGNYSQEGLATLAKY